jgi:phosphoribosylformylglycinamidine synthase
MIAVAEAARNLVCVGALPTAITNNLNFGNPLKPEVYFQFREAAEGMAEACSLFETPVTGGNVSFYNETGATAILPTPVVGVLGVIEDVSRRTPSGFSTPGQAIYLLGSTRDEFGGSEWAHVVHGHLGGHPPRVDLAAEKVLADVVVRASHEGVLGAAHDLSDGGLAQALVESCLRYGAGARIQVPDGVDPFVFLFSESQARAIVAVRESGEQRFADMCAPRGLPFQRIGVVDGTALLDVDGLFAVPLDELRSAHEATLPVRFEN